jgi:hypothetical protein
MYTLMFFLVTDISTVLFQDESFWEKSGTLGRKKKAQEVKEVETEGKYAIDSPGT